MKIALCVTWLALAGLSVTVAEDFKFTKEFLEKYIYTTLRENIASGAYQHFDGSQFEPLDKLERRVDLKRTNSETGNGPEINIHHYNVKGMQQFSDKKCRPSQDGQLTTVICHIGFENLTVTTREISVKGPLIPGGLLGVSKVGKMSVVVRNVDAEIEFDLESCTNAILLTGQVNGVTFDRDDKLEIDISGLIKPKDKDPLIKDKLIEILQRQLSIIFDTELKLSIQEFYNILKKQFSVVLQSSYPGVEVNPTDQPTDCKATPISK